MKRGIETLAIVAALAAALRDPPSASADEMPLSVLRTWSTCNDAGWRALAWGDYARAEKQFNAAISAVRPYMKQDARLMARSYNDLARVLFHEQRYAEAEPLARWALVVREQHPRVKPVAVFQSLYVLAKIEIGLKHYAKAEPLLKRALALQEESLGSSHGDVSMTLDELAGTLLSQKKYAEAETFYKRALEMREQIYPPSSLEIAESSDHYAALLRAMDRLSEASFLEGRARAIRTEVAEAARQAEEAARLKAARARSAFRGF